MSRLDPRSAMGRWLRTMRRRLPNLVFRLRGSGGAHQPLSSPAGVAGELRRLEAVVASPDPRTRQRAVDALAKLEPLRGERILGAFLDDPSPEVRRRALALGVERPTLGLMPALIRALDDPQPELREMAIRALRRILRTRESGDVDPESSSREELLEWWKGERLRERRATSARISESASR